MSPAEPLLVIGSTNRKKGLELAELVGPLGITVQTLADFPDAIDLPEDGDTFAANAQLKAAGHARQLGQWVLADDSGLVVDALGGAPGIFSARYAGPEASDEANNRRLLDELGEVPLEKRTAHYVCHAALSDPAGTLRAGAEAVCHGRIGLRPQGTHGFGYDPLFELVEYHRTFGQLSAAVKECLSHRARAIRQLIPAMRKLLSCGEWS